jgi:predicted metal-binding membrane protein
LTAESALAALLRRDRLIVLAALIGVTALAWSDVLHRARAMSDMAGMPGMAMDWHFPAMFAMWTVMMIGMMTPAVAPMILIYTQVARRHTGTTPFSSAFWFVGGYLLAWTGFSLLATLTQWGLQRLALLSPMMASSSHLFGGLLLIAAGLYQWLPIKHACLSRCRAPLSFIMQHGGFQMRASGSLRLGLQHGLYCVGCCWALMALLFVGGVMNLLWIAGLMAFVLLERLLPGWRYFARASGAVAAAYGLWIVLR